MWRRIKANTADQRWEYCRRGFIPHRESFVVEWCLKPVLKADLENNRTRGGIQSCLIKDPSCYVVAERTREY